MGCCRKLKLAVRYARAVARWAAAGKPVRPPAEIARLFAVCRACADFRAESAAAGTCNVCGCPLRVAEKRPHRNKLAMATEKCPAENW